METACPVVLPGPRPTRASDVTQPLSGRWPSRAEVGSVRDAMGATGDAEQPRGPGGAERGGPEQGDAGAASQLVLTVRAPPHRGRARPGLGPAGPRAPRTLAHGRENAAAGTAERVGVFTARRPGFKF